MSKSDEVTVKLDELVTLWLDGFGSGIATLALNNRVDIDAADKIALDIVNQLTSDDVALQDVIDTVRASMFDKCREPGASHTISVSRAPRRLN